MLRISAFTLRNMVSLGGLSQKRGKRRLRFDQDHIVLRAGNGLLG